MDVWVLGATGRVGRAILAALHDAGVTSVGVGRDAARLEAVTPPGGRTLVAGSVAAMATEIRARRPTVVINTIGPFTETAETIARACLPHSHYLDLANDVRSFTEVLDLHERAAAAGRTLVPGAGFGVVATEAVVASLCEGRPLPERVRTDMVPALEGEAGQLGEALAATIVEAVPDGGRRYVDGALHRATPGHDPITLTLPDGAQVTTAGVPLGELVAARRASGAPSVIAASTMAPHGVAVRALLPVAGVVLAARPIRQVVRRRLAAVRTSARAQLREHSYGHARIEWADGTVRDGWLRLGSASAFTASVAAVVAARLAEGRGRPGAHTPVAALGIDIAADAGAELIPG